MSALSRLENARGIPKSAARSFRVAGVDDENAATRHGSKVFMNRLVERVAGPMIWIVNDIERRGFACTFGKYTERTISATARFQHRVESKFTIPVAHRRATRICK